MLIILFTVGILLTGGFIFRMKVRAMNAQLERLERDLQGISEVVTQMAEVQYQTFQRHSACLDALEERIMELSIPSQNPDMPLERRHQVLTLARQGASLDEIAKRIKAPIGEAEVILNLSRMMDGANARPSATNGQVEYHA